MRSELKAVVTGLVWKIPTNVGDRLEAGTIVMLLESMKMEIPVILDDAGTLVEILVEEGEAVTEGQAVALIEE